MFLTHQKTSSSQKTKTGAFDSPGKLGPAITALLMVGRVFQHNFLGLFRILAHPGCHRTQTLLIARFNHFYYGSTFPPAVFMLSYFLNLFFFVFCPFSCPESIIEFEENRWEPERWQELSRVPGNDTTALLSLAPYVNYQFRVVSVNAVGRSQPSTPSLRYATPPAGKPGSGFLNISIFSAFFWNICALPCSRECGGTRVACAAQWQPQGLLKVGPVVGITPSWLGGLE